MCSPNVRCRTNVCLPVLRDTNVEEDTGLFIPERPKHLEEMHPWYSSERYCADVVDTDFGGPSEGTAFTAWLRLSGNVHGGPDLRAMHHGNHRWPCGCASTKLDVDVFNELTVETLARARCPVINVPYVPQVRAYCSFSTTVTSHHVACRAPLKDRATSPFVSGQACSSIGNMFSNHFCFALQILAAPLSGPLSLHGCDSAATCVNQTYEPMHHGNHQWPCDCASTTINVDVFNELIAETLARARCRVIKVPYVPQVGAYCSFSTTVKSSGLPSSFKRPSNIAFRHWAGQQQYRQHDQQSLLLCSTAPEKRAQRRCR
ncbi:uncharacterized protein LOC142581964 [Dermacentor variabilis]|uniref:uncharacterized protein LOC142581964 n=1 Tax=Dermacentor variabilis TaxID=34621 RepID=UPI003F5BC87D